MSSKIEQLIDEMEEFIDGCKYQTFSSNKIIVNKDQMDELLRELRLRTPEEIKRYQKIVSNKEAILKDAREKAQALLDEATLKTNELTSEHQIMQQAYAQANEYVSLAADRAQKILDDATSDANNIREGAIRYTDEMLANMEAIIAHSMETIQNHNEMQLQQLQHCYELIVRNRSELYPPEEMDNADEYDFADEDGSLEV